MTLSRVRIFENVIKTISGSLLRHVRSMLHCCPYSSSYAINDRLRFENENKKDEQEKEVRSKYVFRPRLPVLIENDYFDASFQYEYDKICRECYAWDSEMKAVKTVWARLKPPPQEKVEEDVLVIGNLDSLPWAPNEWCIERAFDCYRNRRDVTRIHLTIKYLEMLKRLPNLQIGLMLDMAHHMQQNLLIKRTRKLFELVCQTYYTGNLKKLIESDENAEPIVEHMHKVEQFEAEKREVLNITEQDIVTVAPGLYGQFPELILNDILKDIMKYKLTKNQIAMPYEYPYNVPYMIFGNFGYWYSRKRRRFELHDLHILSFPILPWYKDLPGTEGKFFSPIYERIPLSKTVFN
ncbi:unnamed protein product [Brugia timori]|uniref:39S ribosomal protein L50, mitochondrial n=1 Tax=Brugia timori TaxID=42155 RepID=A0A0R3R3L4_9BILA|nr:unnamed protein product [Brugia timori]